MTARALMVLGTASHVGKSLLCAALCRILVQEGYGVAPFKAQNMALNSAATPEGLEIGRAQAMQAEAARIAPTADMNPVLIKPSSAAGAQIVVRGRLWGRVKAGDYQVRPAQELFPLVVESYQRLAGNYDIIVLEGAGSPAEINLKAQDLVNMRMAEASEAACLLIGDIDRGGVFASLWGTLALLEETERMRIRGFVINKFRGDESLLRPGIEMIERRMQKPCAGIIHYLNDIGLDEEDSVALSKRQTAALAWRDDEATTQRRLRVGVIALPYISNFTDFDALAAEPSVALAYLTRAQEVMGADVVVIPGTKQTIKDLQWLKQNGLEAAIAARAKHGLTVGLCGGMQMLGREVTDSAGLEGGGHERGLGLLPIRTVLTGEKVTRRARAKLLGPRLFGQRVKCDQMTGYEIHLGSTAREDGALPLLCLVREGQEEAIPEGASSEDGRVVGTYLHGFFDQDDFRHAFLQAARAACGLEPLPAGYRFTKVSAEREARFDRLAAHVRAGIDLELVLGWLSLSSNYQRAGTAVRRDE